MKQAATFSAIGILIGMMLILFLCNKPEKKDHPTADANKVEVNKNTPPTTYTDKGGTKHTEKETAVADLTTLKAVYKKQIDSLTYLLNAKQRELDYVTGISTTTTGKFKPKIDTVYVETDGGAVAQTSVSYSDKWLALKGIVDEDSSWFYKYRDSIILVSYYKRSGFLKLRSELYIDGFSLNPNTTISGLSSYKVKAPVKKQHFELNAELRNRWIDKQIQPSAAANAKIFLTKRWSVQGSYGKVLIGDHWFTYQEAAVQFNIIKF
jgi:hypothetical protein